MPAMTPRVPTASQTVGTSYNSATSYNSPLTYNQATTVGSMAYVVKPTASASPRTLSTASIKPR